MFPLLILFCPPIETRHVCCQCSGEGPCRTGMVMKGNLSSGQCSRPHINEKNRFKLGHARASWSETGSYKQRRKRSWGERCLMALSHRQGAVAAWNFRLYVMMLWLHGSVPTSFSSSSCSFLTLPSRLLSTLPFSQGASGCLKKEALKDQILLL